MRRNREHSDNELRAFVSGYIESVQSGARVVGKYERLGVERHLRDLARTDPELRFNERRALHMLRFAVTLVRHTKGVWAGERFEFSAASSWQAFILWSLFGWERRTDGEWRRRFRSAYISVGRKNGKTMLAAIVAIYLLAFDGEASAEVYFAATKRDQAKIGWKQAASIVRQSRSKELRKLIKIVDSRSNMNIEDDGSVCEALGRDADTMDGLSPSCGIVDELHAHKNRDTWDVLESGMGARKNPLMLGPTTAGSVRAGLCWDLDHDAVRILEEVITDDTLFGYIARVDDGDAWDDPAVWPKANPNLGVSVYPEKLEDAARKAANNIAYLGEFRRKHLNEWTEADTAWLALDKWDACSSGPIDADALRGRRCYAAIDLSSTSDISALVLVFPPAPATEADPEPEDRWQVLPFYFIPSETIPARVKTDRVPFDAWVDQGRVIATDGDVIDHAAIRHKLIDLGGLYDIREVPMDPYNGWQLASELQGCGFEVVQFRQGFASMSPAMKEAEKLILSGKLDHGCCPVLRWMLRNISVKTDPAGNIKPDKSRSADRIDGIVSLIMGVGRATLTVQEVPPQLFTFNFGTGA